MQELQTIESKKSSIVNRLVELQFAQVKVFSPKIAQIIFIWASLQTLAIFLKITLFIYVPTITNITYDHVLRFANFLLFQNQIEILNPSTFWYVLMIIIAIYIIAQIIIAIKFAILVKFGKNSHSELTIQIIRGAGQLHAVVLQLPMMIFYLDLLYNTIDSNLINTKLSHAIGYIILSMIGMLVGFVVMFLSGMQIANLPTENSFSLYDTKEVAVYSIFRMLSGILIVIGSNLQPDNNFYKAIKWILGILSIMTVIYVNYRHCYEPSFANRKIRQVQIFSYGIFLNLSIINLFLLLFQPTKDDDDIGDSFETVFIQFLLLSPIFLKLEHLLITYIENQTLMDIQTTYNLTTIRSFIIVDKIITILQEEQVLYPHLKNFSYKNLESFGIQKLKGNSQFDKSFTTKISSVKSLATIFGDDTQKHDPNRVKNFVETLKQNTKLTEKNSVLLADLLAGSGENIISAFLMIVKVQKQQELLKNASSKKTQLAISLIINKIQKIIDSNQLKDSEQSDVGIFIQARKNYNLLSWLVSKQVHFRDLFYKSIKSNNPCFDDLKKYARKVQKLQLLIEKFWQRISLKNVNDYPPLLRIFGMYNIFIINQTDKGNTLLRQYNKIIAHIFTQEKQHKNENNSNVTNLLKSMICLVDCTQEATGRVRACTTNSQRLLGISSKRIVGKNISTLMPTIIAQHHDSFILSKIKANQEKLFQVKSIESFMINNQGFLLPCSISMRLYPNVEQGLYFWGKIATVKKNNEFILMSSKRIIDSGTSKILLKTGISKEKNVSISHICPYYDFELNNNDNNVQIQGIKQKYSFSEDVKSFQNIEVFNNQTKLITFRIESKNKVEGGQGNHHPDDDFSFVPYLTNIQTISYQGAYYFLIEVRLGFLPPQLLQQYKSSQVERLLTEQQKDQQEFQELETPIKNPLISRKSVQFGDDCIINQNSRLSLNKRSSSGALNFQKVIGEVMKRSQLSSKQSFRSPPLMSSPSSQFVPYSSPRSPSAVLPKLISTMDRCIKKHQNAKDKYLQNLRKHENNFLEVQAAERTMNTYSMNNTSQDDQDTFQYSAKTYISSSNNSFTVSNQQAQDRASIGSTASVQTERSSETQLLSVIQSIPFAKFKLGILPIVGLLLYQFLFISSILAIYYVSTSSIEGIDIHLQMLRIQNTRFQLLSVSSTRILTNKRYEMLGLRDSNVPKVMISRILNETSQMLIENSKFERQIQKLQFMHLNFFYESPTKLYESNFQDIPNAPHTLVNNFDVFKILGNKMLMYANLFYPGNSTQHQHCLKYLEANLYNDIWLLVDKIDHKIFKFIKKDADKIYDLVTILMILNLTIVSMVIILISCIWIKSILESEILLRNLINHNINDEIDFYLSDLSFFTNYINEVDSKKKLVKAKTMINKGLTQMIKKKPENQVATFNKRGDTKKFRKRALLRIIIIMILMSIPVTLFIISKDKILNKAQLIKPYANDIYQITQIYSKTIKTFNKIAMYITNKDGIAENEHIETNFEKDFQRLLDSVSVSMGYTYKASQLLSENICLHKNKYVPFVPALEKCEETFNGVAQRGLKAIILEYHAFVTKFVGQVKQINDVQQILQDYGASLQYRNSVVLVTEYIRRAVITFGDDLTAELEAILKQGTDETINFFWICFVLGWMVVLVSGVILFQSLILERKQIIQILCVMPQGFIFMNKNLRNFMLKQSKRFLPLLKQYNQSKDTSSKINSNRRDSFLNNL